MKNSILTTVLLTLSLSAQADLFIAADYSEDCAQPDITVANQLGYNDKDENIGYYNEENLQNGLIHPAIYVTRDPEQNAALSIDEIKMLVYQYWENVITIEDHQNAESCGVLRVVDLDLLRIPD